MSFTGEAQQALQTPGFHDIQGKDPPPLNNRPLGGVASSSHEVIHHCISSDTEKDPPKQDRELTPSPRAAGLLNDQRESAQASAKLIFGKGLTGLSEPSKKWADSDWDDPAPVRQAMSPERLTPLVKLIDVTSKSCQAAKLPYSMPTV